MRNGAYSRRLTPRAQDVEGVYVFWNCQGRDYLSAVRDLGPNGLFIASHVSKEVGASATLHFLVGEGQIRAKAMVRHVVPGKGIGMKFTVLNEQDRLRFSELVRRVVVVENQNGNEGNRERAQPRPV